MGLFSRKQGRLGTVRAMARFSEDEREQGMDMLQAAEQAFVELGAPSRLGTAIFTTCVAGMGVDEDNPIFGVAAGASLMGYACRMGAPGRALPDNIAAAIQSQLAFTDHGKLDYEVVADPDRLGKVTEYAATLADDPVAIATLAGATPGAWQAFATTATFQLHRNLVDNGLPKRALPSGESLENLMRLGYAIRLVDEVAGEQPLRKDGSHARDDRGARTVAIPRRAGRPPVGKIEVDHWLADAATICVSDFEKFVERLLELGTLERLGIITVVDRLRGELPDQELGDDVTTALANTRMGYALRNREIQLLGRNDYVSENDPFATLLDETADLEYGVNIAVLNRVVTDVLVLGLVGGSDAAYAATPGTTPSLRRAAIESWADQHFPSDDPRTGRSITVALLEYGYFVHRVFELAPDRLEDWS